MEGPVPGRSKNGAVVSDAEDCFGDTLDADMVEGAQESENLRPRLGAAGEMLQHDIDVFLWTLPARERNVGALLL